MREKVVAIDTCIVLAYTQRMYVLSSSASVSKAIGSSSP